MILGNEVDRASATLSDRVAGIERQMQSQSATPATISDENTNAKMARAKSQVKGLKSFASHVEIFVREHCSSEEHGASALEATLDQSEEETDSGGRNWSGTHTAAVSSSSTGPPAYMQATTLLSRHSSKYGRQVHLNTLNQTQIAYRFSAFWE